MSEDIYSVAGGNWQVFDGMIRESQAKLRLNTKVTAVQKIVTPYHTTAPFNCLSILACLDESATTACHEGPVLVKIFSHTPVDLDSVFSTIEWQKVQGWHSYPQLIPRNGNYFQGNDDHMYRAYRPEVPAIVLDEDADGGVYYVNGMESMFSTMESQTVAARHVVQLMVAGAKGTKS
ncbi:hypothetical protein FBU59_007313 [Linderina macrospora]|uniref:Uncharacterized protein n=1 Tax=Linderina macrospora TaxID=4868 RepID=A0ACC1IXH0_9FUNG|nr:hypothetical protein FBU59_007313 [Linderina macrospora]